MKQIHIDINSKSNISDGSLNNPYKNISEGIKHIEKGTELIIHEGVYEPFSIYKECSGEKDNPVIIKNFNNDRVVIQGLFDEEAITVYLENVENITLDGLEVIGGGLGIYVVSTPSIGNKTLENITIKNCIVHGVRGMHGIAVYAKNDLAPISNLTMDNCEVYDCRLDSSESTVFNGNIDGFTICNNKIHDNNNIGIDMIGFEGKAKHSDSYKGNLYDVDFVRNGKCFNNFVYNISSFDNEAYFENPLASIKDTKGEYNLCANGIYVDGGQSIEIYNNFVYNSDIGLEVATEHSPDDNELFKVSDVFAHDNVICSCFGYSGLAIGGYAKNLGFTCDCNIKNNTFIDNSIGMVIQRTKTNNIENNIFDGSSLAIEFNHGVLENDQINNFNNNVFVTNKTFDEYFDLNGKDLNKLMNNSLSLQKFVDNNSSILDGVKSKDNNLGSSYVPNKDELDNYKLFKEVGLVGANKALKYIEDNLRTIKLSDVLKNNDNICSYINEILKKNGLDAEVELMKTYGPININCLRNKDNGHIISDTSNNEKTILEFHLRYKYDDNSYVHKWIRNIELI